MKSKTSILSSPRTYLTLSLIFIFSCTTHKNEKFVNVLKMNIIHIPSGTFEMGNPDPRIDCWDESPVHTVELSYPFYLSETEVTIKQFQQFRPDFKPSFKEAPYVTGISWHDAVEFCQWLSEKEGMPYRLPTEAEWEYAARMTDDYGLKNIHTGPREWCYDWYGPYPSKPLYDPVGIEEGIAKVIRGGGDGNDAAFARFTNRSGYAPAFDRFSMSVTELVDRKKAAFDTHFPGLVGLWYGSPSFERTRGWEEIVSLDLDWGRLGGRANDWSARWEGFLTAPENAEITFHIACDDGAIFVVNGDTLIDWKGTEDEKSISIILEKGKNYPIILCYFHEFDKESFLSVQWSWKGQPRSPIPAENFWHTLALRNEKQSKGNAAIGIFRPIGFRVVQARLPDTSPYPYSKPFVQQCIVQNQPMLKQGPDPGKPWFRRRPLLSMPPDNVPRADTRFIGLHPGMMDHNHSPSLEVCPNGDILMISYTSEREYEPEVSMMATRLRFGSRQWDMPEIMFDFPDANDHAPCLYTEGQKMYFFWGSPSVEGAFPFQWITSDDNGANWSEVSFPNFTSSAGSHSRQPINTVIRGLDGTLYVPNDGLKGTSVLWATKDNGRTWYDTDGRSAGRHTTYAILNDGRILGMGGKNTDIGGYMPKAISSDRGKNWTVSKTPFAALGSNQRPCLIRLQSGRLFFSGDFQHRDGSHPRAIKRRGAYVALSDDEGESWHIKKMAHTLPHEKDKKHHTLGYSVAHQAPNGIIHLMTSMNTPCLHFEMNEAWILSDFKKMDMQSHNDVIEVQEFKEFYPSGKIKAQITGGVTANGEYRLDGKQIWYYENGEKQWEVTYESGRTTGIETYWNEDAKIIWSWVHKEDGRSTWTQYWENGNKKVESNWRNFKAEGNARQWDRSGNLSGEKIFSSGRIQ